SLCSTLSSLSMITTIGQKITHVPNVTNRMIVTASCKLHLPAECVGQRRQCEQDRRDVGNAQQDKAVAVATAAAVTHGRSFLRGLRGRLRLLLLEQADVDLQPVEHLNEQVLKLVVLLDLSQDVAKGAEQGGLGRLATESRFSFAAE